jgi:hypothetical protein
MDLSLSLSLSLSLTQTQHPWFRGINFEALVARRIKPPIVPKIKHNKDLSNFDDYSNAEVGEVEPYVDDGSRWEEDF